MAVLFILLSSLTTCQFKCFILAEFSHSLTFLHHAFLILSFGFFSLLLSLLICFHNLNLFSKGISMLCYLIPSILSLIYPQCLFSLVTIQPWKVLGLHGVSALLLFI